MGLKTLGIVPAALGAGVLLAACGSSNNGNHGNTTSNNAGGAATALSAPATAAAATASPIVMPSAVPSQSSTAGATGPAGLGTPATNPVERLSGMVQSVDAGKVTLKDGNGFSLSPQTVVTKRAPIMAADLKVGQTVAITAKRQPDNTLLASMVVVFPSAPNGFALGQRPLDAGNLMTNATIDKVSGNSFHATFPGGAEQVTLAPDAQLLTLAAGTPADIVAGATITAAVRDGVAQQVSIQ
jgi:hypothetical protein